MRLEILDRGYSWRAKALFASVRALSRQSVPDAARFVFYRPDFYGRLSTKFTQEAMRGHSGWSIADRELMAAYVSKINQCAFCIGAHTATASQAYQDSERVAAVLSDLDTAPIEERLRATLRLLGTLTRDDRLDAHDVQAALEIGVSPEQIIDALAVCFAFNLTNRVADAFGFEVLTPRQFETAATFLLRRGYR